MRFIPLFHLIVLSWLITFGGCAAPKANSNIKDNLPPPANNEQATALITEAIRARAHAETLVASGDMKIHDRGSDFSLGVQIENMVAAYPDKLRMKTTKLAGNIDVFDLLMRDGKIAFYVPRHNALYSGTVNDLQGGGLNFSPDVLMARLLRGDEKLTTLQWRTVPAPETRSRNPRVQLEQVHRAGENFVRVEIDPTRKLLTRAAYINGQNNQEYLVEEYDNYRETPEGKFFPTRFNLIWPDRNRYVKLNLKRHDLTRRGGELAEAFEGLDNVDFNKVQRKPLGQARVESDPNSLNEPL